jgi:transcriptional regulator with XRE-family HTH domain
MKRSYFVSNFANRLNSSLQKAGYSSFRTEAGVDVNQLAKIAGVSYQMARKYALGLAMPDYHVIPKIANSLNVSSAWLLFGESNMLAAEEESPTQIAIECELLKYILQKCVVLFSPTKGAEKIINFIVGMIYDASHINADDKTVLKIIDMMLSSAIQFSQLNENNRVSYE